MTLDLTGLMLEHFVAGSGGRKATLNSYSQISVASALTSCSGVEASQVWQER